MPACPPSGPVVLTRLPNSLLEGSPVCRYTDATGEPPQTLSEASSTHDLLLLIVVCMPFAVSPLYGHYAASESTSGVGADSSSAEMMQLEVFWILSRLRLSTCLSCAHPAT